MEFLLSDQVLAGLSVVLSLVIMETLLSVDNALIIAATVSHLPPDQRRKALWAGLAGAYVFRGLALVFASILIANPALKVIGALYLIYIMCKHLGQGPISKEDAKLEKSSKPGFWMTVIQVELADLAFAIDNVVAAVAISDKFWAVVLGVFIGIATMRQVAQYCIKLMERYPILNPTAYVLVGFIGFVLVVEVGLDLHVHEGIKLLGILLMIVLSFAYGSATELQKRLRPTMNVVARTLGLAALMVELMFAPILYLARFMWRVAMRFHPAKRLARKMN